MIQDASKFDKKKMKENPDFHVIDGKPCICISTHC